MWNLIREELPSLVLAVTAVQEVWNLAEVQPSVISSCYQLDKL